MIKLSEDEIIERLNKILEQWQKIVNINDDIERDIEMNVYIEEMPFYEIKGLLNLYQKEKEKNKELEDKIKAKIEYYKNYENLEIYEHYNYGEIVQVLQELLEEE